MPHPFRVVLIALSPLPGEAVASGECEPDGQAPTSPRTERPVTTNQVLLGVGLITALGSAVLRDTMVMLGPAGDGS